MRIVFLDVDGVISTLKSHWTLDKKKMELVKCICDETGAKIVISSSWRRYTLADTIEELTTHQIEKGRESFLMPDYIVGVTARMYAFIKTHALRGISKRDVEKAIKILNSGN